MNKIEELKKQYYDLIKKSKALKEEIDILTEINHITFIKTNNKIEPQLKERNLNYLIADSSDKYLVFCDLEALRGLEVSGVIYECFDVLKFDSEKELNDFIKYNCPEIPNDICYSTYFGDQYFHSGNTFYILNFIN